MSSPGVAASTVFDGVEKGYESSSKMRKTIFTNISKRKGIQFYFKPFLLQYIWKGNDVDHLMKS